jgi:hypothetical protein
MTASTTSRPAPAASGTPAAAPVMSATRGTAHAPGSELQDPPCGGGGRGCRAGLSGAKGLERREGRSRGARSRSTDPDAGTCRTFDATRPCDRGQRAADVGLNPDPLGTIAERLLSASPGDPRLTEAHAATSQLEPPASARLDPAAAAAGRGHTGHCGSASVGRRTGAARWWYQARYVRSLSSAQPPCTDPTRVLVASGHMEPGRHRPR